MEKNYAILIPILNASKVGLSSKGILRVPINGVEVKIEKRSVTLRL